MLKALGDCQQQTLGNHRRVGHIHTKAFSERFGFDVLESRKFKLVVKTKATGTPLEV